MPVELPSSSAFLWALFAVTVLGAVLRLGFENREDHFVLTIAATAEAGMLGLWSIAMVWGAVAVAVPVLVAWSLASRNRERLGPPGARRAVLWVGVSAASITVGFVVGNLVFVGLLGGEYPVQLTDLGLVLRAGVATTVAWLGTMAVRLLTIRIVSGSLVLGGFDPLDNVLVPYLMPLLGGFPLVVASVALYRPDEPWPALFILWWCIPLYVATAFDLHRRRMAQELRRDLLANQRLAAIGEVSARIAHQSRHQVGLMGWSIHRLRPLVGRSGPEDVAAATAELDALTNAKDRLSEMLASELHVEPEDQAAQTAGPVAEVPDPTAVPLAELVDEVVEQLGDKARRASVALDVTTGLGTGSVLVPTALRDVVFNLVDNAIDAAAGAVTVRLDGIGAPRVTVSDDGPGIADAQLGRAFEPFFTTKGDGTGMGLAIAEAVVGDLGGDLRYERADGTTQFVVSLPNRGFADVK